MQEKEFNIATDQIKITVIIPVYNNKKTIRITLDSILNQTLPNLQIICINDGSTDNSLDILYQYANKDDRILVLEQPHQSLDIARKAGLNLAFGEYVCFVDADEYIPRNQLEIEYKNAIEGKTKPCISYNTDKKCYELAQEPENSYNRLIKTSYLEDNDIQLTFVSQPELKLDNATDNKQIETLLNKIIDLEKNQQLLVSGANTIGNLEQTINNKVLTKITELTKSTSEEYYKANGKIRLMEKELDSIKNSMSYKIGLFITWLPRKIKEMSK